MNFYAFMRQRHPIMFQLITRIKRNAPLRLIFQTPSHVSRFLSASLSRIFLLPKDAENPITPVTLQCYCYQNTKSLIHLMEIVKNSLIVLHLDGLTRLAYD